MKNIILHSLVIVSIFAVIKVAGAPAEAFFKAPQVSGPITIDGKAIEKSWSLAAQLGNFLKASGSDFAEEQTSIKICHDTKNLYLYFRMESFALNSASNQEDSFKADVHTRDGNVWADDSVEFRIERLREGSPIYVALNANGTILDMKKINGEWNKSYNIPIKISAGKANGFWFAEMSIPLNALNSRKPYMKSRWRLNFVRFNQRLHSKSSWALLKDGDHMNMANSGIMMLSHKGPAPVSLPLNEKILAAGKVPFRVTGTKRNTPWKSIIYDGRTALSSVSGESRSSKFDIKLPISKNNGDYILQLYVSDSGGKLIFRSPSYPFCSQKKTMTFSINVNNSFLLQVNDKIISSKSKSVKKLSTDFNAGTNTVTVSIPAGSEISGKIACLGKVYPVDSTWKYADSQKQSNWKNLPEPVNGKVKVPGKGNVILQKTILYRATKFLPIFSNGEWRLSQNGVYSLRWDGSGAFGNTLKSPLKDFSIVIDVPKGLKLLGASWIKYPIAGKKNPDGTAPSSPELYKRKLICKNSGYTRYQIQATFPVLLTSKKESWLNSVKRQDKACWLNFKAVAAPGTIKPIIFYCKAENSNVVELPNKLNCRILPELKAKTPKKIAISLKNDSIGQADESIVRQTLDTLKASGINELFADCHIAYPRKIGIKQYYYFNLTDSSKYTFPRSEAAMDELFSKFPEARGRWGSRKRFGIDLSYVTRTPATWPYIEKAIDEVVKRSPGMGAIFWDYEFSPFPGHIQMYPCFSKKGIDAFAKQYQIKEKLTPWTILKKYHDKWLDFSCGEVANTIKLVQRFAHKHNLPLYVYSGYQNCKNGKEYYNMDWSKVGPHVDRAYCGYGRNLKLIDATQKCLGNKPLIGGLLKLGQSAQWDTPAAIVRKVVDCKGGVLLWYENRYDAGALTRIAEAATVIARLEPFILQGKRCDDIISAATKTKNNMAAYRLKNNIIILLLNEHGSDDKSFIFSVKGLKGKLKSSTAYNSNAKISINVAPGKCFILTGKIK
jgi:hypothetical protein